MDKALWDRWAPATGIAFVVLFVIGFIVAGESPGVGDPAEEVTSYYADDRGKILTATVIFGIALIAFLWFAGTVANTLRESGEGRLAATTIGAGAALVGTALLIGVITAALAFSIAEQGDEGVVCALNDLAWVAEVVISFPAAAFAAAVSLGGWRARLFPDWFGWAGIVGALVLVLGGTVWARDGFWAPDGAFGLITIIVFLLWLVVASVLLLRATAPERRAAAVAV